MYKLNLKLDLSREEIARFLSRDQEAAEDFASFMCVYYDGAVELYLKNTESALADYVTGGGLGEEGETW